MRELVKYMQQGTDMTSYLFPVDTWLIQMTQHTATNAYFAILINTTVTCWYDVWYISYQNKYLLQMLVTPSVHGWLWCTEINQRPWINMQHTVQHSVPFLCVLRCTKIGKINIIIRIVTKMMNVTIVLSLILYVWYVH